jgi:CHAD domain-containing protein
MPQRGSAMYKVRALLYAQLDHSVAGLREHGARDPAVHDARKDLKRARASLRLLRGGLGKTAFRRENLALRDAAKPLGAVRDAKAVLNAFATLRLPEDSGGEKAFGVCVSRALQHDWRECRERLQVQSGAGKSVQDVKRRIARLGSGGLERMGVGAGVSRVYRSGQRAFAKARRSPTDERLHELRKQAKYLFNQIDMLSRISGARFAAVRGQSDRLAQCLGEDHDLAGLKRRIEQISSAEGLAPDSSVMKAWTDRILERRASLQREAVALAKRLYSRRAQDLRAKIDRKL